MGNMKDLSRYTFSGEIILRERVGRTLDYINHIIIKYDGNPVVASFTEELQMEAIRQSKYIFQYIDNPSDKIKQFHKMIWEI